MAFEARLIIGEEAKAVTYPFRFREGALEEDAKLNKLVQLLEVL